MNLKTYSIPSSNKGKTIGISSLNGGIVLSDLPYKLNLNQSPLCKNVWFANHVLGKRLGQTLVTKISEKFLTAYEHEWNGYYFLQSATTLYAYSLSNNTFTNLGSTSGKKGVFLPFGEFLYFLDGVNYLKIVYSDGTLSCLQPTPYVPTVLINSTAAGGGDLLEDYNLLGTGFTVTFSGTDTSKTFQLPVGNLDSSKGVTVTYQGTSLSIESVDYASGVVTLVEAKAPGTNYLSITAYMVDTSYTAKIKNCRYMTTYGGENEVKIIVGGNPDYPNTFFASGTQDGTYFPDNLYNLVGSEEDIITGFGKQYDVLVIFKKRSIWAGTYNVDGSKVRIPVQPVNQNIGCDCPYSIQTVNNTLTWCNTYGGVYGLFSTDNDDERNVLRLSGNVNGTAITSGLLSEEDLEYAVSVDFDGRYWLCVNGRVYLWDYSLQSFSGDDSVLSWWYFDNIYPAGFLNVDRSLYFCSNDGKIAKFEENYKDFDSAIDAYWWMPPTDFGTTLYKKTVTDIVVTSRGNTYTKAQIHYATDAREWDEPLDITTNNFTLWPFSLDTFSLSVGRFAVPARRKVLARNINYFQIGFSNNSSRRDLSISDVLITYFLEGVVK